MISIYYWRDIKIMAMLSIVISLKQDPVLTYKGLGRQFLNKIYLLQINYVWKHQTVDTGGRYMLLCISEHFSSWKRWYRHKCNHLIPAYYNRISVGSNELQKKVSYLLSMSSDFILFMKNTVNTSKLVDKTM